MVAEIEELRAQCTSMEEANLAASATINQMDQALQDMTYSKQELQLRYELEVEQLKLIVKN